MFPVWIPPVTVKFEAKAALPAALFERAETGARPLRAAILAAVCASAQVLPSTRTNKAESASESAQVPLLTG